MRSLLLFWLRDFCWYAAPDPVHDIGWMKATASHTESLRREQPAQVRASNGFLMTPDELGNFKRGHQPIRQSARRRRVRRRLPLIPLSIHDSCGHAPSHDPSDRTAEFERARTVLNGANSPILAAVVGGIRRKRGKRRGVNNAQLRGASKCWVFGAVPCGESVERSASDDRSGGWLPTVATNAIRESYEIVNLRVKLIRRVGGGGCVSTVVCR